MGHEIGRSRLSNLAQDTSGMGLQLSNANAFLSCLRRASFHDVVTHVTTLDCIQAVVKLTGTGRPALTLSRFQLI